MNAREFSRAYAEEYNITYEQSEAITTTMLEFLAKVLYEQKQDLTLYGFGAFKHKTFAERNNRHPITGELKVLPARNVITFKPSEKFKL